MAIDTSAGPAAPSRRHALSQWTGYAVIAGLRFLAIGVGILYVKFYTGVVSVEALGLFFYLTTLSYALNAFVFVPLDFFIQARLAGRTDPLPLPALARVGGVAAASALLLAAIGGSILLILGKIAAVDIAGAFVMAVLLAGCTSGRNILNNRGSRFFVVLMFILESVGRVAALFAVTAMTRPDGRMLFYSAGAALAVELVVIVVWIRRTIGIDRGAAAPDASLSPRLFLASALPVSVSAICNLVQLQSFRLLWVWAGFPVTAAVFAVVANVGQSGMAAAGQVLSQILLPRVYQTKGAFAWTYVRLAGIAIAVVMVVGLALSTQIVGLLTQVSYVPHAPLIAYGILIEGANLVITGITAVMMMRSQTWKMLPCNLAGAAIALAGNGIALYYFPQTPAAIGIPLLLSQTVVLGSLAMLMRTPRKADRS